MHSPRQCGMEHVGELGNQAPRSSPRISAPLSDSSNHGRYQSVRTQRTSKVRLVQHSWKTLLHCCRRLRQCITARPKMRRAVKSAKPANWQVALTERESRGEFHTWFAGATGRL